MTHIETSAENYRQSFRGPDNHISSMDIKKSFEDGANYMLEKACEWLKKHYAPAGFVDGIFRKAMEE